MEDMYLDEESLAEMKEAFEQFDLDGDGCISDVGLFLIFLPSPPHLRAPESPLAPLFKKELKTVLTTMNHGEEPDPEMLHSMIAELVRHPPPPQGRGACNELSLSPAHFFRALFARATYP